MIQREHDGVRWELQPDFAPLLAEVLKAPGERVKESLVKSVTVHRAGGKVYYIKRYLHHAVPLRPWKFLFKPTQAQQEWRLAQQLEARGIPIVRHVALGERRAWLGVRESILITEGFEGVPVKEVKDVDPAMVLRFVENMHHHGVLQADLHLSNLLLRREPFELRLVDLHGTKVSSHLSPRECQQNLAVLRGCLAVDVGSEVRRLSVKVRRELLHQRSRRCLRSNRDFGPTYAGGLSWHVRLAFLNDSVGQVLSNPEAFLNQSTKIFKDGRSATVAGGLGFVLKRYNLRRPGRIFKDLFRMSPACDSFRKAYHLELVGVRTARPIAAAEHRVMRILVRSYFLMEEIPGAVPLDTLARSKRLSSPTIESVAALVGRLHGSGLSHRDLKASNILFEAGTEPCLIDLDGLAYHGEVPKSRMKADLDRLVRGVERWMPIDRRQRARFLRVYLWSRRNWMQPTGGTLLQRANAVHGIADAMPNPGTSRA